MHASLQNTNPLLMLQPLPLEYQGGTSLMTSLACVAIIQACRVKNLTNLLNKLRTPLSALGLSADLSAKLQKQRDEIWREIEQAERLGLQLNEVMVSQKFDRVSRASLRALLLEELQQELEGSRVLQCLRQEDKQLSETLLRLLCTKLRINLQITDAFKRSEYFVSKSPAFIYSIHLTQQLCTISVNSRKKVRHESNFADWCSQETTQTSIHPPTESVKQSLLIQQAKDNRSEMSQSSQNPMAQSIIQEIISFSRPEPQTNQSQIVKVWHQEQIILTPVTHKPSLNETSRAQENSTMTFQAKEDVFKDHLQEPIQLLLFTPPQKPRQSVVRGKEPQSAVPEAARLKDQPVMTPNNSQKDISLFKKILESSAREKECQRILMSNHHVAAEQRHTIVTHKWQAVKCQQPNFKKQFSRDIKEIELDSFGKQNNRLDQRLNHSPTRNLSPRLGSAISSCSKKNIYFDKSISIRKQAETRYPSPHRNNYRAILPYNSSQHQDLSLKRNSNRDCRESNRDSIDISRKYQPSFRHHNRDCSSHQEQTQYKAAPYFLIEDKSKYMSMRERERAEMSSRIELLNNYKQYRPLLNLRQRSPLLGRRLI